MSYLPPGWTEERLAAATADDLKALPYETLHLIAPHKITAHDAQDVVFGARYDESIRQERARFGLDANPLFKPGVVGDGDNDDDDEAQDPVVREVSAVRKRKYLDDERKLYFDQLAKSGDDTETTPTPPLPTAPAPKQRLPGDAVVQVVEEKGYDDFGFVLVRLDYDDEARWKKYEDSFIPLLDSAFEAVEGGKRIVDQLLIMNVEDKLLDGTGFFGAVTYCEDLRGEGMVPPGHDTSMILVIDSQALTSFADPTPGQKPWVWAVDISYPFTLRQQPPRVDDPIPAEYPGYFRVPLTIAVVELWPMLKKLYSPRMLWNPTTPVWDFDSMWSP